MAPRGTKRTLADVQADALELAASSSEAPSTPQKLPKAVREIREKLAGQEPKKETILSLLSAKEVNNLQNNFRNNLSAQHKAEYSKMSKDDKFSWLSLWILDPEACAREGYNKTCVYASDEAKKTTRWVTKDVLEGPQFFNNAQHVQLLLEAGELEARPSSYATLAKHGIMEYRVTDEMLESCRGNRSEAGTTAKTDLKVDEYEEVRKSMENSLAKPAPKKRVIKEVVPINPQVKELKDANAKRSSVLRQVKRTMDSHETYVQLVLDTVPLLERKGYPQQMMDFFCERAMELRGDIEKAKGEYSRHVMKKDEKDPEMLPAVRSDTQVLEKTITALNAAKQTFEKKYGADIKKLSL